MNSYSWNKDNSSKNDYPYSFDNKIISHIKYTSLNNSLNNNSRKHLNELNKIKNHDFNYLLKYVHKYFLSFYKNEEDDYNIKMIEDILDNEETHLVAEFKDFLIIGDMNEFIQKYYSISDSRKYIPKICDYYSRSSLIFPNYVALGESKYIYKNIRRKQKLIDHQQEQDELKEKNIQGDSSSESNNNFFSSKTLNSILQQSNTSNVKIIFGLDDDINNKNKVNIKNKNLELDTDDTPLKIIENLDEIEKEIKDNKNIAINNDMKRVHENNTSNKKYIYIKERNNDLNFWRKNNSNTSSNIYKKKNNNNKRIINTYLSKKQAITENNSKNYNKSNSSINGKEPDYIQKKYFNYFFINSQKKNKRKLLIKNSLNTNKLNTNNKNSLIPSKACISKFFTNNNYSHSVLKYNSFNFITNRNSKIFPFSSSLHTMHVNPLKKKYYYNLNININNSNSAKNMNNNKVLSSNSSEHAHDKNNEKIKKNKIKQHKYGLNKLNNNKKGHNHAVSLTINILNNKDKNLFRQNCLTDRNKESKSENKNIHNNNNLRTIGSSIKHKNKNVLDKIMNSNRNKKLNTLKNENIKSIKNNHINHIKIKSLNFQKINSLSNIKKITINLNNKKQKDNSGENIFKNKIFPKSPMSVKLDSNSNKTLSIKKTLNIKPKKNKNNIYKNINTNNNIIKDKNYFIDSILNSSKNKHHIINHGIKDKIIIEELNKKKSIILPFKKEINIINININGYNNSNNTEKVSLTSRESKNKSKKKLKEYKGRNKAEINFYNQEIKTKFKNKNENNNIKPRNDRNNPVIVKSLGDNIGKNWIGDNQQNTGFFTSRK